MNLEYNHNRCDTVIDLRTGKVWGYDDPGFHENFGGKCYYTSQTGNSFAGWIPDQLWVRKVGSYRTGVPHLDIWFGDDTIAGKMFAAPFSYQDGSADEYPLVAIIRGWQEGKFTLPADDNEGVAARAVRELREGAIFGISSGGEESLFLLNRKSPDEIKQFLIGTEELERREISIDFIPAPGEEMATKTFVVFVTKNRRFATSVIRRVVEAIHRSNLGFKWPEDKPWTAPFWTNLGLHEYGGNLYKIASGIARAKYSRELLLTDAAALQAAAPKGTVVVAPGIYIQKHRRDDYYSAAGMISDGEAMKTAYLGDPSACYDTRYEFLHEEDVVRAMLGDATDLQQRLGKAAN